MKANITKILIIWSLLFSTFYGCKDNDNLIDKMEIKVCNTQNPTWIKNEISSILNRTSSYIPVKISVCKTSDVEIVCVQDMTNSNSSKAVMFYDCSGNEIEFSSNLYNNYLQQLQEGKFT